MRAQPVGEEDEEDSEEGEEDRNNAGLSNASRASDIKVESIMSKWKECWVEREVCKISISLNSCWE